MKRLLAALRIALLAALALLLIGLADHFTTWPLLTSTLGPTAYFFFSHPREEWSSVRNASIGHAFAIGAGLAGLWITASWRTAPVFLFQTTTLPHVFAVTIAIAVTLFVLNAIKVHHAPAAATSVLVASGLAEPGKLLAGLTLGLAALFLLQMVLNRIPAPVLPQG